MTDRSVDKNGAPSFVGTVLRASGTFSSGRLVQRLMTLAGVLIVLVYWRQTGGW